MSFWSTSEKEDLTNNKNGEFNAGGGDIDPIPKDTQVKAACDEAKWEANKNGSEYISLRWTVLAPVEYKNRKIFQKLRVSDDDNKKADKAKRMLAAIATNAGGGLLKIEGKPTGADLQKNLLMRPMALTLQVWELEREDGTGTISGNWVQQVAPLKSANQPKKQPEPEPEPDFSDDDMGF